MSTLQHTLTDYLELRRELGYKLARAEKLLGQFLAFLEETGSAQLSTERALAWACLPSRGNCGGWHTYRLSVVRGFARYLQSRGIDAEVPPSDLLPWRAHRASPYLYTEPQIRALIEAARGLRSPLRVATYQVLIGLLAVTGLRVGEAIHLDRDDFDAASGVLLVRQAKFNKTREIPLHPSTVTALRRYLARPDRRTLRVHVPALLVSPAGTRLLYCNVQWTFHRLVLAAGLRPRTRSCRPRIHDLRHSFAVRTLIEAYEQGADVQQRLGVLSTYLGHVDPTKTYWYLSASPELLGQAAKCLERHTGVPS